MSQTNAPGERSASSPTGRRVGAIILAAGESTRMAEPKALLPWAGTTLLEYAVTEARATCTETVVVLGHEAERLTKLLGESATAATPSGGRPRLVYNSDYRSGKCSSIRAGIGALSSDVVAAVILAVDQPRPAWLIDLLIAAQLFSTAPITLPTHLGKRGHPPVFAAGCFAELLAISEERQGLREVLVRHASEIQLVEISSPLVLVNLNTPADYEAALALASESVADSI